MRCFEIMWTLKAIDYWRIRSHLIDYRKVSRSPTPVVFLSMNCLDLLVVLNIDMNDVFEKQPSIRISSYQQGLSSSLQIFQRCYPPSFFTTESCPFLSYLTLTPCLKSNRNNWAYETNKIKFLLFCGFIIIFDLSLKTTYINIDMNMFEKQTFSFWLSSWQQGQAPFNKFFEGVTPLVSSLLSCPVLLNIVI